MKSELRNPTRHKLRFNNCFKHQTTNINTRDWQHTPAMASWQHFTNASNEQAHFRYSGTSGTESQAPSRVISTTITRPDGQNSSTAYQEAESAFASSPFGTCWRAASGGTAYAFAAEINTHMTTLGVSSQLLRKLRHSKNDTGEIASAFSENVI